MKNKLLQIVEKHQAALDSGPVLMVYLTTHAACSEIYEMKEEVTLKGSFVTPLHVEDILTDSGLEKLQQWLETVKVETSKRKMQIRIVSYLRGI